MTEVALYSALYGEYEYAKPLPADLGCRAILYTDEPDITAPGWEVRAVTDHLPLDLTNMAQGNDPSASLGMLRHKFWKCHPTIAVPDADVTLWVDASLMITVDNYAKRCLEALGDDDWCAVRHPARTCIYTEGVFSATLPRYHPDSLYRQMDYYRNVIGHPPGWGLIATGANVRRHNDRAAEVGEHWWWEIITRNHQDQVSLPVLFRIAEQDGFTWNLNMPWGSWWGVYEHGRPYGKVAP